MRSRSQVRPAFTLIEMICILLIIASLTVVLFPMISKMDRSRRNSVCLNNLKQIGFGVKAYCADWDDCLPDCRLDKTGASGPGAYPACPPPSRNTYAWRNCLEDAKGRRKGWSYSLRDYVKSRDTFLCPADGVPLPYRDYSGSYEVRYCISDYMPAKLGITVKWSMAKRPIRLVYIYETNNWHRPAMYPYIIRKTDPGCKGCEVSMQYCNALFIDGHVAEWPVPPYKYTNIGDVSYDRNWFLGDVNADNGGPNTGSNDGTRSLQDFDLGGKHYLCDPYDLK